MKAPSILLLFLGSLLFLCCAAPVSAETAEELARQASMDYLGIDLTDPQPGYQKTAQDYVRMGHYYSSGCRKLSTQFNDRMYTWAKNNAKYLESGYLGVQFVKAYERPSHDLRLRTLNNPTFQEDNPGSFSEYTKMVSWCNAARDSYNMAASMTAANDYKQQAEIYDGAANVYDTVGNTTAAEDARDEAAFARGRQRLASGSSDCLIVTATFGSPMAGEVQLVRSFRDNTIRQDYLGSQYVTALNAMYYSFSPAVARSIDGNPSVKPVMRVILAPLIGIVLLSGWAYSLLSFSPGVATIVFILLGGALIGLIYLFPIVLSGLWVAGKNRWHVPAIGIVKPVAVLWAALLMALVVGAVLKNDFIAMLGSGLLFACTVILTSIAVSLFIYREFWQGAVRPE